MFDKARLKLTAWYLLIIMFISVSFSVVIYRGLSTEVERFARTQRVRILRGITDYRFIPPPLDLELVEEVKKRIIFVLVVVNGVILFASGSLGYLLAGRTLRPIADMIEEQNRFISDASHELRTPLTALRTSFEVGLRDPRINLADAKETISAGIRDVKDLQRLSDSLLQLSQFDGSNNNGFEKIQLSEIITQAVNRVKPMAKLKKIKINNIVGETIIKGDRFGLTDLFVILLDNAVKYSSAGKNIVVGFKKSRRTVSVSVKDSGIGIAEKDFPHIFDRFYRASEARSKDGANGYGLGLSIARKIISNHGGSIKVESKLGIGTTMTVTFPTFS